MEDPRALESQETGEGRKEAGEESRELEEATFEPEARVERGESIEQAEAIEAAFVEAVQATAGEAIAAIPLPIPAPTKQAGGNEIATMPIPIPTPAGDEISATPIPLPDPALERRVDEISATPIPLPTPAPVPDLDQISATPIPLPGQQGTTDATPITLPDQRGITSEQAVPAGRGVVEAQQAPVEYSKDPPPPPPDARRMEPDTGGVSERGGAGVMSAIPLEGAGAATTGESLETGTESSEQPEQALMQGEEAGADPAANALGEAVQDVSSGEVTGEADEGWTAPEMYAHVDSSGAVTIVDADGKPIDSPPTVTKVVGDDGKEEYLATYTANGKTYSFEVTSYISLLSDLYVGYDEDGKLTVFNGKGEKVDSPPAITKFVDDKGMEKYAAYYPSAGPGSGVVLDAYAGSLQNCYAHYGQDGKVAIVDADGNPLKCQPAITKYIDSKGVEQVVAYYPGAGEADKVTLSSYSTSLQNCFVNYGQDGKVTIVDADGKPLASQPVTYKFVDVKGVEQVVAHYAGTGDSGKITLSSYSTSLQNCYSHIGQDGKITIVGADGKPLASQPLTYKLVDIKGMEHIIAYYAGDETKTTLSSYLPPSGKSKSGGSI